MDMQNEDKWLSASDLAKIAGEKLQDHPLLKQFRQFQEGMQKTTPETEKTTLRALNKAVGAKELLKAVGHPDGHVDYRNVKGRKVLCVIPKGP